MPLFSYHCTGCDTEFEALVIGADQPACPDCGSEIDRGAVAYEPQRPDRIKQRKFSIRVSQMATPAIALKQIVADWCLNAVRDPDAMIAFCCDRLAKPKSTTQALTPAILTRARSLEEYTLAMAPKGLPRFAGLDTGDRFWFAAREVESPLVKRLCWLEQVSPANARTRVPQLFATLGLACLFIDIGNERQIARDLVLLLNGLAEQHINIPDAEKQRIDFGTGVIWDGERKRWLGLKCAAVEFSLKPGGGVVHTIRRTQEGLYYPVIQANRDETIQHVVDELLTADDGFIHVIDGKLRTEPILRLPAKGPGAPAIVETFEMHLLAGSRKEKNSDGKSVSFIDQVENHLLLANAYSALAETVGGTSRYEKPGVREIPRNRSLYSGTGRGVLMC